MFNKFKKINQQIKAVHEDDFVGYLKSIGIYNEIVTDNKHCIICGDTISIDNLQIIEPVEEEIRLVCSKKECVNKSTETR